jgi:hypothetical protein
MSRRFLVVAVACTISCSAVDDFSKFHFVYDGGVADLAGGGSDGGGSLCKTSGQRLCVDNKASGHCEGTTLVTDRHCPSGSICSNGFCQPPPGANACTASRECLAAGVCVPFVVNDALTGFCVPSTITAGGGLYTTCGPPFGDDSSCATGLCADDASRPLLHQCLFVCGGGGDCPSGSCDSISAPMTIEGVPATGLHSCFM